MTTSPNSKQPPLLKAVPGAPSTLALGPHALRYGPLPEGLIGGRESLTLQVEINSAGATAGIDAQPCIGASLTQSRVALLLFDRARNIASLAHMLIPPDFLDSASSVNRIIRTISSALSASDKLGGVEYEAHLFNTHLESRPKALNDLISETLDNSISLFQNRVVGGQQHKARNLVLDTRTGELFIEKMD